MVVRGKIGPVHVEELEFDIPADELPAYLAHDRRVWTAWLESRPGFVRKEVWRSVDRPGTVIMQIWWETRDHWKAITMEEVAAVDAQMGEWFRGHPACREYEVVWHPEDERLSA